MTTRMETRVEGLEKAMEEHNTRLGVIENQLRDQAAFQRTEFEQLRQLLTTHRSGSSGSSGSSNSNGTGTGGNNTVVTPLSLQQSMELPSFEGKDVLSWIARANQYFLVHNTPAERRVQVALIALAGPAMAWVQVLLRRSPLIAWDDFSRELQIRFGTSAALDEYEALHTTMQVGSLDDYIAAFESRLAQLPELTERQYLSFFLGGLKPQIRMQIKDPNIAHYIDAIQMAKRIDFLQNPSEYNTQWMISHQPRETSVARKEEHMLAAMDPRTNSSQAEQGTTTFTPRKPQPFRRISNEEFRKHIAAGTCCKCGLKFGPTHRCPPKTLQVLVGEEDVETDEMFHDAGKEASVDAEPHDPGGPF